MTDINVLPNEVLEKIFTYVTTPHIGKNLGGALERYSITQGHALRKVWPRKKRLVNHARRVSRQYIKDGIRRRELAAQALYQQRMEERLAWRNELERLKELKWEANTAWAEGEVQQPYYEARRLWFQSFLPKVEYINVIFDDVDTGDTIWAHAVRFPAPHIDHIDIFIARKVLADQVELRPYDLRSNERRWVHPSQDIREQRRIEAMDILEAWVNNFLKTTKNSG